jgi:hypothetical protein
VGYAHFGEKSSKNRYFLDNRPSTGIHRERRAIKALGNIQKFHRSIVKINFMNYAG